MLPDALTEDFTMTETDLRQLPGRRETQPEPLPRSPTIQELEDQIYSLKRRVKKNHDTITILHTNNTRLEQRIRILQEPIRLFRISKAERAFRQ